MEKEFHVAIVPSPGIGHLIPLVEFAKRLKNDHNISATFIIPNDGPLSISQNAFLDSLPNGLAYLLLPPVNFDDLPPNTRIETRINLTVTRSLDSLREVFKSLVAETKMVALFTDMFGTDVFDVAIESGVPPYLFFPSSAMSLSFSFYLPTLDQMVSYRLDCLRWLDGQPRGSVLYISFGSGGTLSTVQLNELAMGLELSKQRFLWVVRSPNDQSNSTFFDSHGQKDLLDFLPKGFLERTQGNGLVVPSWAPQAQILSHSSTGGFLTHCGWNSILETIVHGVPIISWPLYAEQKMNALYLTEGLKVALRPIVGENGIVGHLEISRVVRGLMEGEEGKTIRSRIQVLKDSAANVLGEDGCSRKTLEHLASKLKHKV
ncbi:hypothetical protein E3N88_36963 [Mikania micrantha]|uniref:Uncharacterized protein n=1 Tax=Mikania micrantha TaxID=192012 RepID=A0A5N6M7W7_9ASTR|nr:hypothetical protein E3N88_36963 [Mikania micrantha]